VRNRRPAGLQKKNPSKPVSDLQVGSLAAKIAAAAEL
jgi:hypothetical protein